WDQHARIDRQRQAPEAPLAEDVRGRLARPPTLEQAPKDLRLLHGQSPVRVEVELEPREAEGLLGKQLGVDARRVDPRLREHPLALGERLAKGHVSSARRRSSAVRASVKSS